MTRRPGTRLTNPNLTIAAEMPASTGHARGHREMLGHKYRHPFHRVYCRGIERYPWREWEERHAIRCDEALALPQAEIHVAESGGLRNLQLTCLGPALEFLRAWRFLSREATARRAATSSNKPQVWMSCAASSILFVRRCARCFRARERRLCSATKLSALSLPESLPSPVAVCRNHLAVSPR